MQMASMNLRWQNRINENRLAFAGQMGEIAEIMDDLSLELSERKENSKKLSDVLVHKLEKKRLKIKKISVTDEGSHGRRQKIYLLARVRRGRCMTVKELAEIVSETAGQRFIPEKDSPGVVSRKFSVYELVEDTRYRIIQGIADGQRRANRSAGIVTLSYIWIRDRFSCPYPMAWAAVRRQKRKVN